MSGKGWAVPQESNGGVPVNIQDQTSEPIDSLFNQSVSNFTIASDTTPSTSTVLNYDFTATAGHGIVNGNEILLLDVVGDRAIQAIAVNVAVNTITLDRPIDHIYPAASTLGRIVVSDMTVNGSLTPQIFTFRTGTASVDVTRILLTGLDSSSMDFSTFLGQAALTNGFAFSVVNGFQKTIFNFKTNRDIAQFCYDVNLEARAPSGQYGLSARISFAGTDKHGVALRLSGDDVLQWIVQDDLTGAVALRASVQGHKVVN